MFHAEIEYTKQDVTSFYRLHKKLRYRVLYIILDVIVAIGVLLIAASAVILLYLRAWSGELTRYFVVLAIVLMAWVFFNAYRKTAALKSMNGKGCVSMTATEEGIHVSSGSMSSDFGYDSFSDLVHSRDAYYLYVDKRRASIVPERCFVEGDPAAFGRFMEEKTGLKMKEIK